MLFGGPESSFVAMLRSQLVVGPPLQHHHHPHMTECGHLPHTAYSNIRTQRWA